MTGDIEQLKEDLSRFSEVFSDPQELTKEAVWPITTSLLRERQFTVCEDVLLTFASATPYAAARAWALANAGAAQFDRNDYEGAVMLLSEAKGLFESLGDNEGLAKVLVHLADIARFSSHEAAFADHDLLVNVHEEPVDLYQRVLVLTSVPSRHQRAQLGLASVYIRAGAIDEAIAACRASLEASKELTDTLVREWSIRESLNLATQFAAAGHLAIASEIAEACRALCKTFGINSTEYEARIGEIIRVSKG